MTKRSLNAQQDLAARTLEGPLLISAGAGSGKTSVLSRRAANAVVPGQVEGWEPIDIGRLLAITFTEKAAGELAERVRAALRAAGRAGDARRVDGAWIATIHGMCARILRQSALEAGIDPYFSVLETAEAARLKAEAFEIALSALIGDAGVGDLLALHSAQALADTVVDLGDLLRTRMMSASEIRLDEARPVRDLIDDALAAFADLPALADADAPEASREQCTMLCGAVTGDLRELADTEAPEREVLMDLWRLLCGVGRPSRSKGISAFHERLAAEKERLAQEVAAAIVAPLGESLLALTEAYAGHYAQLKRTKGALDFEDLQSEALRVLQDPTAGARWAARFDLTMVDEFQDTDRLQLRLVEALAGDRICTVGDEQQSIYGFRGAELGVYREHRERMAEKGALDVPLQTNYRSHADILDFVNKTFGAADVFGGRLVELRPAETRRRELDTREPRVQVLVSHTKGRSEASGREAIAKALARRLHALHDEGVPAGDMAVLMRGYRHAGVYADAIRREGLDVLVIGGSRFFEQPEVRALRALVALFSNTEDEEALGALLVSDMVGVSDDGLLGMRRHAQAHGGTLWRALEEARLGQADRLLADAVIGAVKAARVRSGSAPLSERVLRAIEDLGYDAFLIAAGSEGGQAYANVLKFARMADAFETSGGAGPGAFVEYLDEREALGEHEPPASLVRDGSDAVLIMSIHSAKGLEFPVVAVPELGSRGGSGNRMAIWSVTTDGAELAVKLPASELTGSKRSLAYSPTYARIRAAVSAAEDEESARLLYVACTRAEDVLLLAGGYSPGEDLPDDNLGIVLRSLALEPGAEHVSAASSAEMPYVSFSVVGDDGGGPFASEDTGPAAEKDRLEWLGRVLPKPAEESAEVPMAPERLSFSAIHSFERCPLRWAFERESVTRRAEAPAMAFGTAFHAVAQIFGESTPVDPGRVRAIARFHGLDDAAEQRLLSALEGYRASKVARRLGEFDVRRETPFALRVGGEEGGFELGGNIDVFAARESEALIVDFKTGTRPMSARELEVEYGRQADCYALAALKSGYSSVEVVFVRPEADEGGPAQELALARGPKDVDRIERELLAVHSAMSAGTHDARPAREPGVCEGCPVPRQHCRTSGAR